MEIFTDRLLIRAPRDDDFKEFVAMNGDEDVMKYFPDTLSEEECLSLWNWIKEHHENYGFGVQVIEWQQNFVGIIGLIHTKLVANFTPCVEAVWRTKKEYWNNGFATESAKAIIKNGLENDQINEIFAFTAKINEPSERVMIKCGMTKEGEFDHPNLSIESVLSRHVLYKITR